MSYSIDPTTHLHLGSRNDGYAIDAKTPISPIVLWQFVSLPSGLHTLNRINKISSSLTT